MRKVGNKNIQYIIGALFIAMVPNIPKLPLWIAVWCILLWSYMAVASLKNWPWPNRWVRLMFTAIGIIGILVLTRGHYKGGSYLGLLAIMATLKPMEIRSYRDKMVTLFIAYFIVITGLFESESLVVTFYMFISVFFTTGILIHINQPNGKLRKHLRLSGRIMIQALPLVLLLFFLFPRIQGTLWGVTRQGTARTGFSDSMSPGDISNLVKSNETVFWVRFEGDLPEKKDLYFRGMVLWNFDGRTWTRIEGVNARIRNIVGRNPVKYSVTLEPHGEKWLFALDLPYKTIGGGTIFADNTLKLRRRLKRKFRYRVDSFLDYNTGGKNNWEKVGIQIPETGNPKSRKLATEWKNIAENPQEIIAYGLDYLRVNDFEYTLKPPVLKNDTVDDFLFRSRKGYCEHYASAFAFLMRAAGVPSRIIVGYLGGKINPYGNFLVVRQTEAHAWVEVWLSEKGWVRIDPTSIVAPGRIEIGLEGALQPKDLPEFLTSNRNKIFSSLRFNIKLGWEALNNQWDTWFSGYSSLDQRVILEKLGIKIGSFKHQIRILFMMISLIVLIIVFVLVFHFKRSATPRDRIQELYSKFCNKLEKVGYKKNMAQGAFDFAQNINMNNPRLGPMVMEITDLYIQQRYAGKDDGHSLKKFRKLVRNFNPKKIG